MKKYTEYQTLTPLEVAEIGERDGWPIEGLIVGDDGKHWTTETTKISRVEHGENGTRYVAINFANWRYCARPVERIEWQIGDTVQNSDGLKGKIARLGRGWADVDLADKNEQCGFRVEELEPWKPGYGYTEEGRLIEPEIKTAEEWFEHSLPYLVALRATHNTDHKDLGKQYKSAAIALAQSFNWHETPESGDYWLDWYEWLTGYLEETPSIEPDSKTAVQWFRYSLPPIVANKAIENTSAGMSLKQYESAADALKQALDWEDTPEDTHYWWEWHMWLHGDLEEMPPIEPEPIAQGHNPDELTVSQVGEGWRLLSREEIAEREPTEKIQAWLRSRDAWSGSSIYAGSDTGLTYRTQQPEGYFLLDNETAKMGQVWLSPPDHEGDCQTVIVGPSTEPQWELKLCKCSYFPTEAIRCKNGWHKVADSLDEYYDAKV